MNAPSPHRVQRVPATESGFMLMRLMAGIKTRKSTQPLAVSSPIALATRALA